MNEKDREIISELKHRLTDDVLEENRIMVLGDIDFAG
jgi:hypothetical protein